MREASLSENDLGDRFDQLDQPAFGSSGSVPMDQVAAGSLINRFLREPELGLDRNRIS